MAFYAGRVILDLVMKNLTIVALPDRSGLDDQLPWLRLVGADNRKGAVVGVVVTCEASAMGQAPALSERRAGLFRRA